MHPEPETYLTRHDPILGKIINQLPRPEIESTNHVFHDLMSCIIEQQIHYRSTKKSFQKLLNAANIERLEPENFDIFEKKALINTNLSIWKYETIVRVLEYFQENQIPWHLLTDEAIIAKLSSIKGIGKWSIDMILLYTLQRPDVFPYDDFHLKQIMVSLYKLNEKVKLKAQMQQTAAHWGAHKSLAVLYLLEWKKINKNTGSIELLT